MIYSLFLYVIDELIDWMKSNNSSTSRALFSYKMGGTSLFSFQVTY